jgi:GWxTD domain-containing protein
MRRMWTLVVICVLALPVGTSWAARKPRVQEWIRGPVLYIAYPAEIELFRMLEADDERASFIEGFWHRRDPTPDTLTNEYRELFWQRVKEANLRFIEGAKPGWKTDRGKIHVLHGAPSTIEDDPYFSNPENPVGGRGVIRWIYEGQMSDEVSTAPVVVVAFERDASGEYRLSQDPRLASEFYDLASIVDRSYYERWLNVDIIQPSRSPLALMADMGRIQEIPTQEQILVEQVDTFETYGAAPLDVEVQRYRDPDGGAVLALSAALPGHAGERPTIVARLRPRKADAEPRLYGDGSFLYRGTGGAGEAQARIHLEPGTYDLTVLALTPGSDAPRMHTRVIQVGEPEADESLRMSDLALARELEPVRYATLATYDQPFVVGHFRVVPRFGNRIPRGEPLALFYEVYGGTLPFRITYQLEGLEADGEWVALGRPVVQEGGQGAQGWSLPTGERWPLGEYRVVVVVEDGGGASTRGKLPFELVEPDPS